MSFYSSFCLINTAHQYTIDALEAHQALATKLEELWSMLKPDCRLCEDLRSDIKDKLDAISGSMGAMESELDALREHIEESDTTATEAMEEQLGEGEIKGRTAVLDAVEEVLGDSADLLSDLFDRAHLTEDSVGPRLRPELELADPIGYHARRKQFIADCAEEDGVMGELKDLIEAKASDD
jgi:chromosome segregation ATPase